MSRFWMLFVALFALAQVPALAQDDAVEDTVSEEAAADPAPATDEAPAPSDVGTTETPAPSVEENGTPQSDEPDFLAGEEPAESEKSSFDAFDAAVGTYIVGPMAKVRCAKKR